MSITKVAKPIVDTFGVSTNEFVRVGGNPVAANNPDLCKDYFDPNVYCHPELSFRLGIEFDKDGNVKLDGKVVYTAHEGIAVENCPMIYCDITKDNVIYHKGNTLYVPMELIPKDLFTECLNDGIFYQKKYLTKMPNKPHRYRSGNAVKKLRLITNIKDQLKYGIRSSTYSITEGKRYTFGAEIETSSGFLPHYLDKDLNYEAVHDGSLRDEQGNVIGGEYVTGVLTGDSGFLQLKRLCNELTKRCTVNKKCGVHIHIGGVDFTKEFIVYLYKVAMDIEKEIYAMLPKSRSTNEYCRPLPKMTIKLDPNLFTNSMDYDIFINDMYNMIFQTVSYVDRINPTTMNKKTQHPLGNKCGYNHATPRYCWLNLVPALFDTRGNGAYTLEIRNHSATLSYTKIKNWTLITMAIMWFVENEKQFIANNKVSLSDIIRKAYPKTGEKLMNYIYERTAKFSLDSIAWEANDYSERELNNQLTLTTI